MERCAYCIQAIRRQRDYSRKSRASSPRRVMSACEAVVTIHLGLLDVYPTTSRCAISTQSVSPDFQHELVSFVFATETFTPVAVPPPPSLVLASPPVSWP